MYETASRGSRDTRAAVPARPPESPLDDWLGDVSDDDWSEEATARAQQRGAATSHGEVPVAAGETRPATAARATPGARPGSEDAQAVVRRRRLVAGLAVAIVLGVAVVSSLLLLRGGEKAAAPTVAVPTTSTPAPEETPTAAPTTSTTPTTPASTTPSTTTPPAGGTTAFALPEGTKLQAGAENDAALVRALQQALTKAGYNPGAADGTFGPQTEAAVVAFQQDNGLAVDGRVGPETATALANALAAG